MENEGRFNEDFTRWYAPLDITPDPDARERRRKGVLGLLQQTTVADLEALVRVAFRSKQAASAEQVARLRKPLRAADDSLPLHGVDRELQLMCGAALAELFRRDGETAAVAALAVTTAGVAGSRRPELPLDLVGAAEKALAALGESRRRRPEVGQHTEITFPQAEFEKLDAEVQGQRDPADVTSAFSLVTQAVKVTFQRLIEHHRGAMRRVAAFLTVQDEELDMLWWLVGGRSWDLDRPLDSIPLPQRVIVVAAELARLTGVLPGPPAIRPLLTRVGITDDAALSIVDCVNACDAGWLESLLGDDVPSSVTRPIHFAIARKLETGDDSSWVAGWSAATGLDASAPIPALALATLFYRERLVANSVEEGE